jgi:tetratricopeptide (TPR) repeat protein
VSDDFSAPHVDPAVLARFEERIGEDVLEQTLALSNDDLRRFAGDLVPRVGGASLYELLGVSPGASGDEIYVAYVTLARRVHPALSERLGLPEGILRLLFENLTHAYLNLEDPARRKAYDRAHPPPPVVPEHSDEELATARREMARKAFRRAQSLMRLEEFHYVVELMRDAVQWDPRPEAYALLGEALGKNPKWRDEAIESLQTAIRMAPRDPGHHLRLATLFEEMERLPDALAEYKAVLERSPNQPDAVAALDRLGSKPKR